MSFEGLGVHFPSAICLSSFVLIHYLLKKTQVTQNNTQKWEQLILPTEGTTRCKE